MLVCFTQFICAQCACDGGVKTIKDWTILPEAQDVSADVPNESFNAPIFNETMHIKASFNVHG